MSVALDKTTCAILLSVALPTSGLAQERDAESLTIVERLADDESIFSFDFGVPDSPGITALGLESSAITTSTSLKPFVVALPALFDPNIEGQAAALDFAPMWFAQGYTSTTVNDYADGSAWFTRLAHRTRVSSGLYQGLNDEEAGNVEASRLSVGLSFSLLDASDPLVTGNGFWNRCLTEVYKKVRPIAVQQYTEGDQIKLGALDDVITELGKLLFQYKNGAPFDRTALVGLAATWNSRLPDNEIDIVVVATWGDAAQAITGLELYSEELDTKRSSLTERMADKLTAQAAELQYADANEPGIRAAIDRCSDRANEMARNAADIDLGVGRVWNGEPGQLSDFGDPSTVIWASLRLPLRRFLPKDDGQILERWNVGGSLRVADGEFLSTEDEANPIIEADTLNGWIGVERVSDSYRFSGRYGWLDVSPSNSDNDDFEKSGNRYLISAAYRISGKQSGTWLELSYGSADGTIDALNDDQFTVSLLFGPPAVANAFE